MDLNGIKKTYDTAVPYAGKRYWYLRSFQLITQFFTVFLFFGMLMGIDDHGMPRTEYYHNLCSAFFYIFFLWSLRNTFRKLAKSNYMDDIILKQVRMIKWVLLILCIVLLTLTIFSIDYVLIKSQSTGDISAYRFTHIFPELFNPNIGFLIITLLAFYLSEILTIAKKLKEEQSLTI